MEGSVAMHWLGIAGRNHITEVVAEVVRRTRSSVSSQGETPNTLVSYTNGKKVQFETSTYEDVQRRRISKWSRTEFLPSCVRQTSEFHLFISYPRAAMNAAANFVQTWVSALSVSHFSAGTREVGVVSFILSLFSAPSHQQVWVHLRVN